MRILYITELWNGFEDLICRGKSEAAGMPSFVYPLKAMIEEKGFSIDFAIVVKQPKTISIGAEWLKSSDYYWVCNWSFVKIITLYKIIRKGNYDFVYGQGTAGGWGNFASLLAGKPFGMRLYGTFLAQHLDDNYFRFFRRRLLKSFVYNLPKQFMIMTNDGTKGDLVYNKLCLNKRLYKYYFWLNGVKKDQDTITEETIDNYLSSIGVTQKDNLLLYPARYDPWKRQELAIEILHNLPDKIRGQFKLLLCGHNFDKEYYEQLKKIVDSYGLINQVIFHDPIEPTILHTLMASSFAVLSLYKFSNLGNVIIEASLAGAFVFTVKDGSTDFLIDNGVTGISLPYDDNFVSSIASQIVQYSENKELTDSIKQNLKKRAELTFLSWEQRSENEIELIDKSLKKRR